MTHITEYTIRKVGDNYGLFFRGEQVGLFASRKVANKYKVLGEHDRRKHLLTQRKGQ